MNTVVIPVLVSVEFVNLKHVDKAVFFVTNEDHACGDEGDSYCETHKQLCLQIGLWVYAVLAPSLSFAARERMVKPLWEKTVNSIPNSEYDIYAENWSESLTYWLGVLSSEIAKTSVARIDLDHKPYITHEVGCRIEGLHQIGVQHAVMY